MGPSPIDVGPAANANATTPDVPTDPLNVQVTPAADGQSATLTWSTPASNGGSAITGYGLSRTASIEVTVGVVGAYNFTGLNPGGTYTFFVAAKNAVGSGPAGTATAVMPVPLPPPAPLSVPGLPVLRKATSGRPGGRSTAKVTWSASVIFGSTPITGYKVLALKVNKSGQVVKTLTSSVPASARELKVAARPGRYKFSLVAVNAVGQSAKTSPSRIVTAR